MKVLADTHAFIWWTSESSKLTKVAYNTLADPTNVVFVSVVSIWEIQIKLQAKKLKLDAPLKEIVNVHIRKNRFRVLGIDTKHIYALEALPPIHKDPFDRLLICQALSMKAAIVSSDGVFKDYPARVIW